MGDTPQINFQSNQNFDPDIREMYKHFVTGGSTPGDNDVGQVVGIDDFRAQISVNATGTNTADLIKSLNLDPTTGAPAPTTTTSTPVLLAQESRCHTLYRIIGFPVVSSDKKTFYNPGLDTIKQLDANGKPIKRNIDLTYKINVAKNVGSAFEKISQARELFASGTAQIFSVPESVEAGVLSLTSGTYSSKSNVNRRLFVQPFSQDNDPFDFNPGTQAYSNPGNVDSSSSWVGNGEVKLADYQDSNGVKPNLGIGSYKILRQHSHIIKPFMVDPRIDFSIWTSESKTIPGLCRRVAVPFVPDASFLKTSDTAKAERPLLEKIITDAYSIYSTGDVGNTVQNAIDYVKSNKSIQSITIGGVAVGDIFSGDVFKTSQQQAFAQYLLLIEAMIAKLVGSMHTIHQAQGIYYWLPVPSVNGPEGGCTVRDVPLNVNITSDLVTKDDFDIIVNQTQVLVNSILPSMTRANSTPDPGGNVPPEYKLTFSPATSDSQGDLNSKTQSTLTKKRNAILTRAGEALQIVEMIMGEFSGLGLADIIAVTGALYIMPPTDLLGFLDADAIVRAEVVLGAQSGSLKGIQPDIEHSMNSLTSYVFGLYKIMDTVFQEHLNNNELNL